MTTSLELIDDTADALEPETAATREESRHGLRVLQTELALQKQHRRMLAEQRASLLTCDRERFMKQQEKYARLLVDLERQSAQRSQTFGEKPVMASVQRWPQPEQRRGAALAEELHRLLEEVKTINAQNQHMIGNELKYIDFMLDLLVTSHRQSAVYGANGASASNRGNLFLNKVA